MDGRGLKPLNDYPGVGDAIGNVGLEAGPKRVVVCTMTLVLEIDEELSKGTDLSRKAAYFLFLSADLPRPAVVEGAVSALPRDPVVRRPTASDERICATLRQAVKESVVDRTRRPAEIGLEGPAPTAA